MSSRGRTNGRQILRSSVPILFAALALLILMPLALASLKLAIACFSLLVLAIIGLVLGASRTGSVLMVVAFGLVNFDSVHVSGSLRVTDIFFVMGVVFLLPRFAGSALDMPLAFTVGAIGLLSVGIVSAVASGHAGANFSYFFNVIKGVIILPILFRWWRPTMPVITAALSAYVLGNCINLIASLINGPVSAGRYAGLSSHPNLMGYGQVLSLALMPFLAATLPRKARWLLPIAAAACAYGIYISGSRAALLGAIAATLLYPVLTRSIPAALGVAALFAPALIVVGSQWHDPSSSSAIGRLLGAPTGQASNAAREQGAQFGIDQFLHHPLLGGGWPTIWSVHTGYIQVAAAIGIFGLVFYLVLLSSVLRPLVALPSPYRLLAAPALTAVMLDLVLPVIGAMFEWSVVGLTLCAGPLAAQGRVRSATQEPVNERVTA